MSALRILHLLASFDIGGAELVALRLARAQRDEGHEPLIVGFSAGPLLDRMHADDLASFVMHKGDRFDAGLPLRLASLLGNERADVIHSHNPMGLVYAAPAAKLAGVASVHTKHGEAKDIPRRMLLLRAAARLLGGFVCVSEETRAYAEQTGEAPRGRLHVIDNGVDTRVFRPDGARRAQIRGELGLGDDVTVLGTVGRLSAVKNQALLLRAAAPLLDERHALVIAGDGPERARLESLAASLGCDVHFLGARGDVDAVLDALDVFVLSSDTEGLPLVLLEAMASELPVVSTDVGGIGAVLGERGKLVPKGDERALREALAALLAAPAERRRLGALGRARVEADYSLASMHAAYMRLYRRLLAP